MAEDQEQPRNRRERRAAAKSSGKPIESPTSTPKIKLAQPDRSGPKGKTLLDLYDDNKTLLEKGQPFDDRYDDGLVRDEGGNILEAGLGGGEPIGPVGEAVFWAVCLCMFHFTLDVLTFNQYRQDIEWSPIFQRTFTVLPILWLLIYVMRSKTARKVELLRQVFFLAVGVSVGCYTIHVGNVYDYYAVMKQAPPLGTLWVWSVIEMQLPYALIGVASNIGYMFFKGYTVF